jgi:hypothetical protein
MKTIKEQTIGDLTYRILEKDRGYIGVIISNKKGKIGTFDGPNRDVLWSRLFEEAAKAHKDYFGFSGAKARFLKFFPGAPAGFYSARYLEPKGERVYKEKAREQLLATVPLSDAAAGTGLGEKVLSVFQRTGIVSPFEKIRTAEMLRGPMADAFVKATARFTLGDDAAALSDMAEILHKYDNAKWPVATYLPFLWQPDRHMFLKPTVTKDFATRVGHRFASDYDSTLTINVYQSLLNLVNQTEHELADLKPRDRIDIQSFIWVVGSYDDVEHADKKHKPIL